MEKKRDSYRLVHLDPPAAATGPDDPGTQHARRRRNGSSAWSREALLDELLQAVEEDVEWAISEYRRQKAEGNRVSTTSSGYARESALSASEGSEDQLAPLLSRPRTTSYLEELDDEGRTLKTAIKNATARRASCRSSAKLSEKFRNGVASRRTTTNGNGEAVPFVRCHTMGKPFVQFLGKIGFCSRDAKTAVVTAVRVGDCHIRSRVYYTTKDRAAVAGQDYKAASGCLEFGPGVDKQDIEVPILHSEYWEPTKGLVVELLQEGIKNAQLVGSMSQTNVFIIESKQFPSNVGEELLIKAGDGNALTFKQKFKVFSEFIRLLWHDSIVWRRSLIFVTIDQLSNIFLLLNMLARVFCIDQVLNERFNAEDLPIVKDKVQALIAVICVTMGPIGLRHLLENWRCISCPVLGRPRMWLQRNLIYQYFHIRSDARTHLTTGDVFCSLKDDTSDLVGQGFLNFLQLFQSLGHVTAILVFNCLSAVLFDRHGSKMLFYHLIGFAAIIGIYSLLRGPVRLRLVHERLLAAKLVEDRLGEAVFKYDLVSNYNMRGAYLNDFVKLVEAFNEADCRANQTRLNDEYFLHWLTVSSASLYLLVEGYLYITVGQISLGGEADRFG
eukprot:TRINITY_DN11832_c1_g1_i5.p1 TRINITY_DN11832_c1_g1~~TRINITY_DN11832_c1_g1_i5.p1  ORF type:complete len:613 (-),score=146.35 TRINITY_DN11832_c1_g1_i5:1964-3802(-)